MSKSKRRERNQRINQEFAHMNKLPDEQTTIASLQAENQNLRKLVSQLQDKLEELMIDGRRAAAVSHAVLNVDNQELHRIRRERDGLKDAIMTHYREAVTKTHIELEQAYEQLNDERNKLDIRGGVENGIKRMLLDAAHLIMNVAAKDYNEKLEPKVHQLMVSGGGVFDNPVLALTQAGHLLEMKGRMSYAKSITTVAIMQQCPPEYICSYVVSRLKHKGEVDEISLEALPPNWIQDNIPEAPAKITTLKEWLETAYQFRISGQDQETFARAQHFPSRRLRDYLRCLEAFENAAMRYENEDRTKTGQK